MFPQLFPQLFPPTFFQYFFNFSLHIFLSNFFNADYTMYAHICTHRLAFQANLVQANLAFLVILTCAHEVWSRPSFVGATSSWRASRFGLVASDARVRHLSAIRVRRTGTWRIWQCRGCTTANLWNYILCIHDICPGGDQTRHEKSCSELKVGYIKISTNHTRYMKPTSREIFLRCGQLVIAKHVRIVMVNSLIEMFGLSLSLLLPSKLNKDYVKIYLQSRHTFCSWSITIPYTWALS